jgi:hypothetical protein
LPKAATSTFRIAATWGNYAGKMKQLEQNSNKSKLKGQHSILTAITSTFSIAATCGKNAGKMKQMGQNSKKP